MKDGLYLTKPNNGGPERKAVIKGGKVRLLGSPRTFLVGDFFQVNTVVRFLSAPR